jgi:hypothetical protein
VVERFGFNPREVLAQAEELLKSLDGETER